jgi:hypothetical protein
MRTAVEQRSEGAEKVVRDIRRANRRQYLRDECLTIKSEVSCHAAMQNR